MGEYQYRAIGLIFGGIAFLISWIVSCFTAGFLGFLFGWIPSLIVGFIVFWLWPIVAIALLIILYLVLRSL